MAHYRRAATAGTSARRENGGVNHELNIIIAYLISARAGAPSCVTL